MAATEQKFNIKVATQGTESLTTLKAKLANLGKEVNATKTGFQGAAAEIKKVQANTDQSVNSLRNFASSWRELANSVSITSKEFRTYTREAEKAERAASRASGKPGMGGRGLAQSIGTVAASGVFGGPEGAIGSLIGLPFGPGGAAAGGAAGAQLGMVRQAIGDTAVYAASLNKLQIALKGVTGSATEYAYAQQAINNVSQQLNIPILEATQGFTRLTASVIGAGGKVADAEVVFNGITRAIKATGGGAEEVSGALLALSQVFSKGKVSAEELNQIAERLPGTYTSFAKAAGKNGPELAKALQSGTVGLNDLMKFATLLNDRYAKSADKMAKAQEDAGARMTTSLDKLKAKFGNFFIPVGAQIQTFIGKLADMATATIIAFETADKYTKARNQATQEAVKKYGPGKSAIEVFFGAKDNTSAINTYINTRAKQLYNAMQKTNPAKKPELTTFENLAGDGGSAKADRAAAAAAKREKTRQERIVDQQKGFAIDLRKLQEYIVDIQNKGAIAVAKPLDAIYLQYVANTDKIAKDRARLTDVLQKRIDAMAKLGTEIDPKKIQQFMAAQDQVQAETMKLAQGEFGTAVFEQMSEVAAGFDAAAKSAQDYATALRDSTNAGAGFREGANSYVDSLGTLRQATSNLAQQGFQSLGDSITNLAVTGTANFREFAAGILKATAQMIIQQFVLKAIMQAIGFVGSNAASSVPAISGDFYKSMPTSFFAPSANGNIFNQNGIQKFAMGGVVNRPTIFPFANGTGLMGEAGPEAIMPLQRAANGKLGVIASGGGTTNVTVNVDAGGTSVEGDQAQAKQLGIAVSAAVQAELVKQQRPGGLLAGTRR
jgi:lambda family phage tail tape measure protein